MCKSNQLKMLNFGKRSGAKVCDILLALMHANPLRKVNRNLAQML